MRRSLMTVRGVAHRRRERLVITAVGGGAPQTTFIQLAHRALAPFTVDQRLGIMLWWWRSFEHVQSKCRALLRACGMLRCCFQSSGNRFRRADPPSFGQTRDRPNRAGVRLRQVYAGLAGRSATVTSLRGVRCFERGARRCAFPGRLETGFACVDTPPSGLPRSKIESLFGHC
jgi:hypothetical protein